MEQFVAMLGHEGCITVVVLGLVALVFIIFMITMLVYDIHSLKVRECEKVRACAERMQIMENRRAVYMELVTKGVDKDEALRAVQSLHYN